MLSKVVSKKAVLVELSWLDTSLAAQIGMARQLASLKDGREDQHGFDGLNGWTVHIEGAGGELAVAKFLGVFWSGSVDTFKNVNDVCNLEVRTRSKMNYELIVRNDDKDDDIFVLVVGRMPNLYIIGWIKGKDAKQQCYLESHGDREEAYFVPQYDLNDPQELKDLIIPRNSK